MEDARKTKADLLNEMRRLRSRLKRLERTGTRRRSPRKPRGVRGRMSYVQAKDLDPILTDERYRDLFENSGTGIIIVDETGKYLLVNRIAAATFGRRPEEITGKSMFDFLPREAAERYLAFNRELLKTGGDRSYEDTFQLPSGERSFLIVDHCLKDEQGRSFAIQSSSIDITHRKRAEAALQISDERFARVFQSSPITIAISRIADNRLIEVNKAWLTLTGFRRDEVIGRTSKELDLLVDPVEREMALQRIRSGEGVTDFEFRLKRKSGEVIYVLLSAERIEFGGEQCLLTLGQDFTERRRAEHALQESEERYRGLLEESPEPIIIHFEGKLLYVNPAGVKLVGAQSVGELIGRSIFDFIHPQDREEARKRLEQITPGRIFRSIEEKIVKLDGTAIDVEATLMPMAYQGKFAVQIIARDISERKRAVQTLRESEDRYRRLVEQSPDAILVHTEGKIRYANPAAVLLAGASCAEELIGRSLMDFVHVESRQVVVERVGQLVTGSDVPLIEEKLLKLDGTVLDCEVNSITTTYGGLNGAQVVVRDITERKRAERALRESEERYRDLVEHSLDLICTHDMDGRLLSINPAATKLSGFSEEELVGRNLRDFLTPVGQRLFENYLDRIRSTGMDRGFLPVLTKSGEERIWEYFNTLRTAGVPAPIVRGLARDVTERKRAEKGLQRSQQQLHRLAEHLQNVREEERKHLSQEFHDQLGQTLTALRMDVTMLHRELSDAAKEFSRGALIGKIRSMQDLIDQGTNAIRETMSKLRPELLDQLGLVAALEWELEKFEERSRVTCRLNSDFGELPLDPKKSIALFRIFQEALTNVARHARATAVEVNVRREVGHLVLEIRDNGIGIEPNAEFKANSFGLIGMRERTIPLGGRLEVKGVRGEGTTVLVRMPYEGDQTAGGSGHD